MLFGENGSPLPSPTGGELGAGAAGGATAGAVALVVYVAREWWKLKRSKVKVVREEDRKDKREERVGFETLIAQQREVISGLLARQDASELKEAELQQKVEGLTRSHHECLLREQRWEFKFNAAQDYIKGLEKDLKEEGINVTRPWRDVPDSAIHTSLPPDCQVPPPEKPT